MSSKRGLFPNWLGFALAGAAVVAGAAGIIWQRSQSPQKKTAAARVAAVPFANLTGSAEWDWATAALPASAARQAQGLRGVRAFYAENANQAAALGATHVIQGYLTPGGNGVEVHYTISSTAPAEVLARERFAADRGSLREQSAALARAIRQRLQPGGQLIELDVTSPEAFQLLGEAFRERDAGARKQKLRSSVEAETGCGWCWEELTGLTLRAEGAQAALALVEERKQKGARLSELAEGRLAYYEASLANDAGKRLAALERMAALTPSDPEVLIPLAEGLVNARRFEEGVRFYERAVESDPSRPDILNSTGYALAWAGRYDEALQWLRRYEAAEPDSANPLDSIGEVQMMAGRFEEAEQSLLGSYEKDPRFNGGAALEKAALARWLAGDMQGAGGLLERFLKQRVEERDPLVTLRRARWQYLFGQTTEAVANLRLLARQPGAPSASLAASSLALYEMQAGRVDQALEDASLARQLARDALSLYAANIVTALTGAGPAPAGLGPNVDPMIEALRLTLRNELPQAAARWRAALESAQPASEPLMREMLGQVLVAQGDATGAAAVVKGRWPLLTPDQALLFDFLVYPNLLCVRAAAAAEGANGDEARRLYEQFLKSAGTRPDPLRLIEKARAAVRL